MKNILKLLQDLIKAEFLIEDTLKKSMSKYIELEREEIVPENFSL